MKFILSFTCIVFFNFTAFGQEKSKNSISFDIFKPIFSNAESSASEISRYQLVFERAVNDRFSAVVGFEVGNYEYGAVTVNGNYIEEYTVKGNALILETRFYPFRKNRVAPRGFFLGIYFKNYWLKEENYTLDIPRTFQLDHNLSTLGVDIGYQFFKGVLMVEPVLGFGTVRHTGVGEDARIKPKFSKFKTRKYSMRTALNVGFCF